MLNIKINTNFTLQDIKPAIAESIKQSVLLVDKKAWNNAPYKTWNLRRWIWYEIKDYIWIVWVSEKVPYAKLREYVNKKNPHKRFYMKRALESSIKEIEDFFNKNILAYIIKKK